MPPPPTLAGPVTLLRIRAPTRVSVNPLMWQPLVLLRVPAAAGRDEHYLLFKQALDIMLNGEVQPAALRKAVGGALKQLDATTKARLVELGECDGRGSLPLVTTLASLKHVLKRKFNDRHIGPALDAVVSSGASPLLSIDADADDDHPVFVAAAPAPPVAPPVVITVPPVLMSPKPDHDPTAGGIFASSIPDELPRTDIPAIPKCAFRSLSVEDYGLYKAPVLQDHLKQFESWCTQDVKISRGSKLKLTENTWDTINLTLQQFLCYICNYHPLRVPLPDLSHLLHADLLMHFFACRAQAGIAGTTMSKYVGNIAKVHAWWKSTGLGHSHPQQFADLERLLGILGTQIKQVNPPRGKDPAALVAEYEKRQLQSAAGDSP